MHIPNTQEAIRQFVLQQFSVARKRDLTIHDSLLEQGIVDSMGVMEIVTFLESEFSVTLADDELVPETFASIARLAELVDRKKTEAAPWSS